MLPDLSAETFVRFMRFVEIGREKGACWIWTGNRPDERYGHFSLDGEIVKAHRWIYERLFGPIPDGLVLRHKCDNPPCVNPLHLEPGTHAQNQQDKFERGRGADRRGEKHPMAFLRGDQVLHIRGLVAQGCTYDFVGRLYGINKQNVGKIARRETWKHI